MTPPSASSGAWLQPPHWESETGPLNQLINWAVSLTVMPMGILRQQLSGKLLKPYISSTSGSLKRQVKWAERGHGLHPDLSVHISLPSQKV